MYVRTRPKKSVTTHIKTRQIKHLKLIGLNRIARIRKQKKIKYFRYQYCEEKYALLRFM